MPTLPPAINSYFLVLILKVEGAYQVVSQFRPIALANFLSKIISRMLANRLEPIVSRLISSQQTAFLKSCRKCIGLVSEGFNLLNRKIAGGNVGIKIELLNDERLSARVPWRRI